MAVRAILLSLALLIGIGTLIPVATELAEAGPKKVKKKKRYWRGVKKYSKRWWQLYRAQERRKKALARKKRAIRLRRIRLARARAARNKRPVTAAKASRSAKPQMAAPAPLAILPSGAPAPQTWKPSGASPAELQFRVDNSAGVQVGLASISVVGPAVTDARPVAKRKTVGGVATTSLRREVIDRMIRENGWIVNDYQKAIGGQDVYVVVAQSQSRTGGIQSRLFYFTEVDGKIYSVATNSPIKEADRLAEESEKVIDSLKNRVRPAQRASVKD